MNKMNEIKWKWQKRLENNREEKTIIIIDDDMLMLMLMLVLLLLEVESSQLNWSLVCGNEVYQH